MLFHFWFFSDGYPASQESGRRFFRALVLFEIHCQNAGPVGAGAILPGGDRRLESGG